MAVLVTVVWFSDFWARYLLTFGFWESKAMDFKTSENSAGAVALIGWISLGMLAYATFLL